MLFSSSAAPVIEFVRWNTAYYKPGDWTTLTCKWDQIKVDKTITYFFEDKNYQMVDIWVYQVYNSAELQDAAMPGYEDKLEKVTQTSFTYQHSVKLSNLERDLEGVYWCTFKANHPQELSYSTYQSETQKIFVSCKYCTFS